MGMACVRRRLPRYVAPAVPHGAAQSPDDFSLMAKDVDLKQLPWVKLLAQDSAFIQSDVPCFLEGLGEPVQVEDCSDCLWTSLREALVHIGVSTVENDMRSEIMKYFSKESTEFSKKATEWFDSPKHSTKYLNVRRQRRCCDVHRLNSLFKFSRIWSHAVLDDVRSKNAGDTARNLSCCSSI